MENTYCLEWQKTTLTTYNWFDNFVLLAVPVVVAIVIGFFIKKKKK